MKTKEEIVNNWLPRYTCKAIDTFGKYFLLTNYHNHVELFAKWNNVQVEGKDKNTEIIDNGVSVKHLKF